MTFTRKSDGSLDKPVAAHTSNGDQITNAGKSVTKAPVTAPSAPAEIKSDPVTAPETTPPESGVGGGRDGGGSAKRDASKAQEDNIAVRRQAEGVSGYKSDTPEGVKAAAERRRNRGRSSMAISKNN